MSKEESDGLKSMFSMSGYAMCMVAVLSAYYQQSPWFVGLMWFYLVIWSLPFTIACAYTAWHFLRRTKPIRGCWAMLARCLAAIAGAFALAAEWLSPEGESA